MQKNTVYLIRPPTHSVDASNPLFIYTLADPSPSDLSKFKDLQNRGCIVSKHSDSDPEYRDAEKRTDKAIKGKRRTTQMVYGDMVGDGARLTFEELWERETTKRLKQGLYEMEEKKEEFDDTASIMSQMTHLTQKIRWMHWADEGAEKEAEAPNVSQIVKSQPSLNLGHSKDAGEHVYQGPAGSPVTRPNTNSTSQFIEEDETTWHAIPYHYSSHHPGPRHQGQEVSQSSASSTASSKGTDLFVDLYLLAMATFGHWCPAPFLQAWSRQNPRSQSAAPRTRLSSNYLKKPRKQKKIARRNSEPGVSPWRPPKFVRPLSWVKRKRYERGNANLNAPAQTQTENSGDARRPSSAISQHSTTNFLRLSPSTTLSDSSTDTLQPATSTASAPSLHSHQNTSTALRLEPRDISPAPSTSSSLIFPGREISQEEYLRRTNRPRQNSQPRQLTPPPGLEVENDPYEWQAWDRGRTQKENKTNRFFGIDSMRRSGTEKAAREGSGSNWYDDFRKKMKEEQAQVAKEQKQIEKEKKKDMKKLERQERRKKEEEAREAMKKQGMFAAGYIARYT